jgi:NAD(P)-dependent dehydrogenase (short-subunit alcohol dehydrogenase family)
VNNAGVMACPKTLDSRGYELQFSTNHLGHFQLTNALWPALVKANGARIVCVSSLGHRFSPVVFEDINFEHRDYDRWLAYGQSKTANILFALTLDERGQRDGIRAFSLHPGGIIETDLKRHLSDEDMRAFGIIDENGEPVSNPSIQLKTISQGASTQVWCATSSQLNGLGGVYCENCDVAAIEAELDTSSAIENRLGQSGVMPYAIDPLAARRLWAISEEMIGLLR